jgi:GNAT superfamily N-acetyltransferase
LTAGVIYEWRGTFVNEEVAALHAEAFATRSYPSEEWDWRTLVTGHSLGWVTAREDDDLIGFVNVPWDGLVHAWLQDTMVAARARHRRVGAQLVAVARDGATAAGCEWLHVDFPDDLVDFYVRTCGFTPTNAGLIALR